MYDYARMEIFKCGRARFIMNRFCGASSVADNARIVKACAANVHCFNLDNLTRLWTCMIFHWVNPLSAQEAVNELLKSLESRGVDVVISMCRYIKTHSYDANSFAILKRFLYGTFAILENAHAKEIRETFDAIFHRELLFRPERVFSLLDLAGFASKLTETHTPNIYVVVDYMRDLVNTEHSNACFTHPIYRKTLKSIQLLLPRLTDDEQKFNVAGALYIFFGNLNILPANDLQLQPFS